MVLDFFTIDDLTLVDSSNTVLGRFILYRHVYYYYIIISKFYLTSVCVFYKSRRSRIKMFHDHTHVHVYKILPVIAKLAQTWLD